MKKIIFLSLFTLLLFSSKCLSWEITDELNAHEAINAQAVENFYETERNLDLETKYLGVSWHNGSAKKIVKTCSGIDRPETFYEWVKIGGVDADINSPDSEIKFGVKIEKPLRHFYDPVATTYSYLTDFHELLDIPNPKMDHITWALTEKKHQWSFHQGLLLYKAAMENKITDELPEEISNFQGYFTIERKIRENMFAASFRALGETLHCAADLCMPAHVRDDSHAGHKFLGGNDFVELTIGYDEATEILNRSSVPSSVSFLGQNKSVRELLVDCARFTNSHFFSNDTVCNTDPAVTPTTYNKKFYNNPSFNNSDFEILPEEDKNLDEKLKRIFLPYGEVLLVVRKLRTSKTRIGPKTTYVVPPQAAVDQASVLLPLAAAAGGEIIDRFLPTMKLGLTVEKDNGSSFTLVASLTHEIEKDIEWQSIGEIKYNGFGEIHVNGSAIATATFIGGQMIATATFNDKDKVQLIVKAGALIHKSDIVEVSVEEAIPPQLVCSKVPEFTQFLKAIGVDDLSRRIGYVRTKSPEVMATVQAQNVDYILINWWFEGAPGSIVHEYFYGWKDFPTDIMGYHDIEFFEQYGQTSKDLEIRPRLDSGISYCVPAGLNTFHLEGYYAEGYTKDSPVSAIYPPSGLLGQSGKYKTVSLDVPFEVQPLSSPVNQNLYADGTGPVQREISFSKIEQNTNNPDSSRMPAWVPITWLMSFKFDGSYTYYFDPLSNQDYKITGFYKAGIPADHWVINYSNRWEFDYNEDGQIKSGVMEYDSLGNLVAKYTASDYVVPSFLTIHNHFGDSPFMTVKNAQVETFGDPKEIYNIFDGSKKEGFYSYVASSISKSVTGFYNNNIPSGDWVVIYSGYKWVFKLDEEGNVLSGIKKYDSSDKLVAQYTSNKNVTPSFYAEFYDSNFALWPKTAYVETFSDAKDEKYYIEAGLKEGSYSSITPKGVTANGQYLHDQKTGVWSYYDPKRIPTDYTETY